MQSDAASLVRQSGPNNGLGNGRASNGLMMDAVSSNGESFRRSIIVLSVINMVAAALALVVVFFDTWQASSKESALLKHRRLSHSLASVHALDMFPLMVLIVMILQGLIFTIVESSSLAHTFVDGCTDAAQVVWLAIWIVPFTTVVFALESVIRHYRKSRFLPQGRWTLLISVGVVMLLLLLAWIPAKVAPAGDRCLGSVAWYSAAFPVAGVMIIFILLGLLIFSAVALFVQVSRDTKLEHAERVAASRMVCQLMLTTVALCFVLPFFVQIAAERRAIRSSQLATIVLNLSGLATCLLHLSLHFNGWPVNLDHQRGRLRPKGRLRIFGRGKRIDGRHITSPVMLELPGKGEDYFDDLTPFADKTGWPIKSPQPNTSPCQEVKRKSSPNRGHYSLFPTARPPAPESDKKEEFGVLQPPNPVFRKFHHREASEASSATVQFALRMSHASGSESTMPKSYMETLAGSDDGLAVPAAVVSSQSFALHGHLIVRPPSHTQDDPLSGNGRKSGTGKWRWI